MRQRAQGFEAQQRKEVLFPKMTPDLLGEHHFWTLLF